MDEVRVRITSRKGGGVQKVRSRRKVFGKEAQKIFFENLAATCNVKWSTDSAGVSVQCVYQRLNFDPAFCEAWCRAIGLGYLRLEARLLEEASRPIEIDGTLEVPMKFDKELALFLLREHKKGLARIETEGRPTRRSASWDEVGAWFAPRLRALRGRLDSARATAAAGGA
jgi:hypothetical protein